MRKIILLVVSLALILTVNSSKICNLCVQGVQFLQKCIIFLAPQFIGKDLIESVCEKQYESFQLCKKVAEQLTPLAIRTVVKGKIHQGKICNSVCPKEFYQKLNLSKQIASISSGGRVFQEHLLDLIPFKMFNFSFKSKDNIKILHLTDIHLDLNYTQNSSTVCNYPICCHKEDGFPETEETKAKPYGSPKCDTPLKLLDSALDQIAKYHSDIDAVIVTGDFSAHNQWQKTQETVLKVRQLIENKIKQKLKIKWVITASGNNEYLPDYQADPSSVMQQAIAVYKLTNEENGQDSIFISINTLLCDLMNLYIIQDQTISIRQLKTLDKVISQHENVYLIGHISPSSRSCSVTYSKLFRAILAKHSKKIKGQFYGHDHLDQFVVNTDPRDNLTVTSFGLLAGSLSPLGTGLPRFRIYELTNYFSLYNYVDYSFNASQTTWNLSYDFKQFYGINFEREFDGSMMKEFQQAIKVEQDTRKKYNSKASGSPAGQKYYCKTYDDQSKVDECNGAANAGFKGKIYNILEMLQGNWGSYGSCVQ